MIQIGCKVSPQVLEELKEEWCRNQATCPTFADYLRNIIQNRHNQNDSIIVEPVVIKPIREKNTKSINQYEELLMPFFEKAKGQFIPFKSIDGKVSQFAIEQPIDILKAIIKTNKFY